MRKLFTMLGQYSLKKLFAAIGVWIVVLALITAPMLWQVRAEWKEVDRVFSSYTTDLVEGRFDEAYEFCGPDFRAQSSRTEFVNQQRQLQKSFGRLLSVSRKGMTVSQSGKPSSWSARISADLNYENGSRRFEFSFHKQDGRWVLYGYEETSVSPST